MSATPTNANTNAPSAGMSMRGQWAVVVGFVLVLAGGLVLGSRLAGGSVSRVEVGAKAPDFHAARLDGTPGMKSIGDYEGQVVLLNLWATWCGPCVTEMPSIQRLYDRYKGAGLKVVAVAVDDPPYAERVRGWIAERGFTFEVLHEGSGKIESDYQSAGIPATFLIGRDGRIRKLQLGAADWDSPANRAVVAQLLGVPVATAAEAPATPTP